MVQSYLDNLNRLGVIRLFPSTSYYTAPGAYDRLEADPGVLALKAKVEKLVEADATLIFERSGLEITAFGGAFVRTCILPYEEGQHATTG